MFLGGRAQPRRDAASARGGTREAGGRAQMAVTRWNERHAGQGDPGLAAAAARPRLWERGRKVAPSPGEAGPGRGAGLSASQRRGGLALPRRAGRGGPGTRGAKAWGRGALTRWGPPCTRGSSSRPERPAKGPPLENAAADLGTARLALGYPYCPLS